MVNRGTSPGHLEDGDEPTCAIWDREVRLSVLSQTFCKAVSTVIVHSVEVAKTLTSEDIGLGQLIERLDVRPRFVLHDAGRNGDGGLWRSYTLHCDGLLTCEIREEFAPNAWELP